MPYTMINIHVLVYNLARCILVLVSMRTITDDQLPPIVDIVMANTQENVTRASIVASMGLQDCANWANPMSVSN